MFKWAIRQKSTGFYLPDRKGRKGFSHDEPQSKGGKFGPRLLHSEQAARQALFAWLQGIWEFKYAESVDWFGSEVSGLEVKPVPGRVKDDMEIVCFNLIESDHA